MYYNNLFIKNDKIYDNTYGCIKQYICANTMWILYVLLFTHRGIIDICINVQGHGRIKIYGINGANNT